ncbi:hypothetical protein [Hyphococcus lacteus]|uniref:Uncharacterized protein n=1 Tax=Hyphococcus lacteus TaxID=3143536 RepID=A0ABV3Z3L7_9PROT
MLSEKSKIELNIVTMDDVRLYAENRLPSCRREIVEQTLIEDDRVRDFVEAKSDGPEKPAEETMSQLKASLGACDDSISCYRSLANSEVPAKVSEFAQSRVWARRRLLDRLVALTGVTEAHEGGTKATAFQNNETSEKIASVVRADLGLMIKLRSAFDSAKAPLWKARIASWISDVDNDRLRISWLSSAVV